VDAKDEKKVHPTETDTYYSLLERTVYHKIMGTFRTTLGIVGTVVRIMGTIENLI